MLIKKIRTDLTHYVYDTWSNEILEIDSAVFALLPGPGGDALALDDAARQAAEDAIAEAQQQGYFSPERPQIANFPPSCHDGVCRSLLEKGPDHLIINLTERCNFRCRYCSYSGAYQDMRTHSEQRMQWPVLQAALDWLLSYQRSEYSLGFYGGEPLMEIGLIQQAVAWMRSHTQSPITFRCTSNGSLLNEANCRFLIDNDFRLNISLDGPAEVNDRYRLLQHGAGGFEKTWQGIQRLRAMAPEFFDRRVSYSLVAAPPVELLKIHQFMQQQPDYFHGHNISVSSVNAYPSELPPEMTVPGNRERFLQQRQALFDIFQVNQLSGQHQPGDFTFNFFKNDFFDLHQRDMNRMDSVTTSDGQCVPGAGKCMIDLDGQIYMCERVGSSRPLGDVWKGFDTEAVLGFLTEYDAFLRERCRDCWMLRLCNKCYIHFRKGDQLSHERLESFCRSQEQRWSWVLEHYIRLREQNPEVFDWLGQGEEE